MAIAGHELVGQRRPRPESVGQLPPDVLLPLWTKTTSAVVKHGFALEYRDLEPPRTGIFDGLRIVIDPDVEFEMQCFVLLHLFGHSVQWVAPSLAETVGELKNTSDRSRFMRVLHDYEFEAAGFGLQLLHERGVVQHDQWYSDFVHTDWRYVERYYQTEQLPPWHECVLNGCAIIQPQSIPPLTHRQVEVRFAF